MRKKNIITNNKEIYNKFNRLYFIPEVVLPLITERQVKIILNNINKEYKVLDFEIVGDYILIKKVNPLNFNIYLKH